VRGLFLQFRGVCVQIFLWGSWIDVLCIFVLDLEPLKLRIWPLIEDLGWHPSALCELSRILIPLDLVGLRLQICRYTIS
jgi:hypothetical protein